jgi:DNA-binding transcriptional MerR regulator
VDEPGWTLDELARRADRALAVEDVRAPNGRAIRWYAMKGLVDRPSIGPGHAARYGERHLLQLVAVKRLQARGMTLAEIQRELAGATEETLRRVADLGDFDIEREPALAALAERLVESESSGVARAKRLNASEASVAAPAERPAKSEPATAAHAGRLSASESVGAAGAERFWARPAVVEAAAEVRETVPEVRYVITLTEEVTLTLPARPGAADLAAMRLAAAPLLELLAERGLTTTQGD